MAETRPGQSDATDDPYTIREFRPGDREGYLDLHAAVFGERPGVEWFDWKYAANPYVDRVPVVVAEREGEIVGARSFFALPLGVRGHRVAAFQACDTMVHADHRRRGLFTRTTEHALAAWADRPPRLSFNFPNEKTLAGNRKLGWRLVENLPVHHRLADPAGDSEALPAPLCRGAAGACALYNRSRRAFGVAPDASVTVTRHSPVAVDVLARLARGAEPDRIHVPRDRAYYEWRYARPDRTYHAHVARRDGTPVGAAVTSETSGDARILEFLPRTGRATGVSAAVLADVVDASGDRPLVTALPGDVDRRLLRSFGFVNARRRPFDRVFGTRPFVVRPVTGARLDWRLGDLDVRDPDNWLLGLADLDVN